MANVESLSVTLNNDQTLTIFVIDYNSKTFSCDIFMKTITKTNFDIMSISNESTAENGQILANQTG